MNRKGLSLSKKPTKSAGGSLVKLEEFFLLEESDINVTIRENVNYLIDQLILDIVEAEMEQEHGPRWIEITRGKTPQEIFDANQNFRFKLEQLASEVTEVKGWHFQKGKISELPRPTAKWLASRTGLTIGTLNSMLRGKNPAGTHGGTPITVATLIKFANGLNTTIQFLLTPNMNSILRDVPVSYYNLGKKGGGKTSASQWHLFIHALAPLPSQNFYLFEKHASHLAGYRVTEDSRSVKKGFYPAASSTVDIELGPMSAYSKISDYKPLAKAQQLSPDTPIDKAVTHKTADHQIIHATLSLFVELRKLTRRTNLERSSIDLVKIFGIGVIKIKTQVGQIMRYLKFTQID